MKFRILLFFLLVLSFGYGQDIIKWDGKYKLQLSDFKSPSTQIGNTTNIFIMVSAGFEFYFSMSNIEFMLTKNFNAKVENNFKPSASVIVAPDETHALEMISYANYQFDLSELYARKIRKKLYEEKGAFSSVNLFKPVFEEYQKEYSERIGNVSKNTNVGQDREKLIQQHDEVKKEIELLSDYCRECKSPKKKR